MGRRQRGPHGVADGARLVVWVALQEAAGSAECFMQPRLKPGGLSDDQFEAVLDPLVDHTSSEWLVIVPAEILCADIEDARDRFEAFDVLKSK